MIQRADLTPTSFDHNELKSSLIEYLKTKKTFENFDYEGSAINTIIDLLTRNTVYTSFLANMLANESFLESAQLRNNVVSHAQKLSYVPRSRVATRAICDIEITPARAPAPGVVTVTAEPGLIFLASVGGETYTFTTRDVYSFSYNSASGKFRGSDVELYQGHFIRKSSQYSGERIVIPSSMIDVSTLRVFVEGEVILPYSEATSITELGSDNTVFFLRQNNFGEYEISFGRDVLGREPVIGSTIILEYIVTQPIHANGANSFIAGSSIGGYSNISVSVKQSGYGGMDEEDIESIRFNAPKAYRSQDRALAPSDYVHITKREFPFVRSVISWGGEDHVPPRYGTQFISVVADAGIEITDTLKRRIESVLRQKGVGSITPMVIDPVIFEIDIDVGYIIRETVSTEQRSNIEAQIKELIQSYSNLHLTKFNKYYNKAEIIDLIKDIKQIESVVLDEVVTHVTNSHRFLNAAYNVNFDNRIKPNTLSVTNFQIDPEASEEVISDDGAGRIVYSCTKGGVTSTTNLGTVNYDTGEVSFNATFVQSDALINISVKLDDENFYVRHNNVVRITSVETVEIKRRGRD